MRRLWKELQGSLGLLVIFSLAGLPFLGLGIFQVIENVQMLGTFARAEGVVVENIWQNFAEGSAYVPRVEYTAPDGQTHSFTDGVGSLPADYRVGERVPVLYDPQGAQPARIHSWGRLWFGPVMILAVGMVPILAGVIGYVVISSTFRKR
jgi:hypothetical protein